MKNLIATVIGMLISLPLIYILQLRSTEAIVLIMVICVGIAILFKILISRIFKNRKGNSNDENKDENTDK
jgi:uncharacterized protein with PQ loop repeat